MSDNTKLRIFTGVIILFVVFLKIYCIDITFFWDAVVCLARPASFFFDSDLKTLIYSGIYDNGDPHIIPYCLAAVWTLFGKSLSVSHIAFLPFAIGTVYQVILLCKKILAPVNPENSFLVCSLGVLLVLANPTILTLLILLGIDLCIIFFATYCLNQILANKRTGLSIAFIGLCLTNRRGMIIAATLMVAYMIKIFIIEKRTFSVKELIKVIAPTLPACFTVFAYLVFRFSCHGWVFSSADSAWAGTSEYVNFYGFMRNIAVYIWRNLDFGGIGLWAVLLFMFIKFGYKRIFNSGTSFLWSCYFLLQFSFLCVTIPITNPFGIRYFAVQLILLSIIVAKLIFDIFDKKRAAIISFALVVILATGNLWLYPEKISQTWDCTLKHLPFYSLRQECFEYMEKENIPYSQTAAGMGLYGDRKFVDLLEKERFIASKMTEDTKFFLYSNISNLKNELIEELNNPEYWSEIKSFERGGIFIRVLARREE